MKIIFAGTPDFAAEALKTLITAGHEIVMVLTQPDRPSGRGMKLTPSAVKQVALEHNLPIYQPEKLRTSDQQAPLIGIAADVMVVAAYGLILPQIILDLPRFGCLNIHASLLPRWRGAAPIQRAILAGDPATGITIMQMDAGLDTGDMLSIHTTPITLDDNAQTLHDKLAVQGAQAIVHALAHLSDLPRQVQPTEGVTYAAKLSKEEAMIDWSQSAKQLDLKIRAFNPFPSAQSVLNGNMIKIWRANPVENHGTAGTIIAIDKDAITVACGSGALRITELQKSGGKRLSTAAFLAGSPLEVGMQFDIA
ncbi:MULTISPECIES: methionyl-tRNA formyltransferase [Deefgea]|uniref:Methionyl-tRNA formyltransferase n=1 Tax=Deefgea chitinilytica TaxID=570276 RepID=A0ABS2C7F4_9NEIS|nr:MULTISPECIES: methionyl-tRNA formyltransferase [Deefgea]MBM5570089.1 methionyl-tRNA formyltransferase [Deefgea chitinilytica]MBM9887318.1 methionyl-tRNA formyltransferase [Deefgea sp. CFH1-16]